MKHKEMSAMQVYDLLIERYTQLEICKPDIMRAYEIMKETYKKDNKLLIAGNGGSASDSEHIVGELMKSFLFERKIKHADEIKLIELFGEDGRKLAKQLEGTLCAIPLTSMPALSTAFINDVEPTLTFAQMLYGYGKEGDVFWGISTSGNSRNILYALQVAKAKGIFTIGLTGKTGGKMNELCDVIIKVPESETFKIQELHLPIYHCLCAMLEAEFFEEK